MKQLQLQSLFVIVIIMLSVSIALCAEPEADRLMGKVSLGSKFRTDVKSRKGIASIAAKIMKIKGSGAIRVRGDFPGAENAEEYLLKSVFMARDIEKQLKPLLKDRFQVFVMASRYSGERKSEPNSVEIFFYPRELKVEDMEALRYKSVQQNELPKEVEVPEDQVQEYVSQGYEALDQGHEQVDAGDQLRESKKMRNQQESEDPSQANELVERVKARAAERARREALKSAAPQ